MVNLTDTNSVLVPGTGKLSISNAIGSATDHPNRGHPMNQHCILVGAPVDSGQSNPAA
jgi:hypothetical protein